MKANYIHKNITVAENYYGAMVRKDFESMASYLHQDVSFTGPMDAFKGKARVVDAAQNLMNLLKDIHIREKFSNDKSVMLAYDFFFEKPKPFKMRAAVLMTIENGLIESIELFYDASPLIQQKEAIFATPEAIFATPTAF